MAIFPGILNERGCPHPLVPIGKALRRDEQGLFCGNSAQSGKIAKPARSAEGDDISSCDGVVARGKIPAAGNSPNDPAAVRRRL